MKTNVFIKTLIITTIVFIIGVSFGIFMSSEKISELEQSVYDLKGNIDSIELHFLFMDIMEKDVACPVLIDEARILGKGTAELAKEVERFESMQKIRDSGFYELKSQYTLTLIRDWLMVEKIKNSCEGDYVTVVYFYSNEDCDLCENQGIILSYFKREIGRDLQVFSIDTDLRLSIVETLEHSYNVTEYPFLIVNGEKYPGLQTKEKLSEIFCGFSPDLSIC